MGVSGGVKIDVIMFTEYDSLQNHSDEECIEITSEIHIEAHGGLYTDVGWNLRSNGHLWDILH